MTYKQKAKIGSRVTSIGLWAGGIAFFVLYMMVGEVNFIRPEVMAQEEYKPFLIFMAFAIMTVGSTGFVLLFVGSFISWIYDKKAMEE